MKETNRNRANVAKRRARQRKLRNRRIALTVCLMLVVMVASIGGTVAWLTAQTAPVVNTFTYGDINIDLYEHEYDATKHELTNVVTKTGVNNYKIIPGVNLPKDPTVEVKAGSEACWLFVKVEAENWPTFTGDAKISYAVKTGDGGWTQGDGTNIPANVYYRAVGATTADTTFKVLADDQVTVSENLTKEEVGTLKENQPKLTFTAYAVQKDGIADAATAWLKVPTT